jgi:hypothetical protein
MAPAHARPGAHVAGSVLATIGLSGGRTLVVRTITLADIDGLEALFNGLSDEDRYFRFFSFSHPGRTFLERMTRAEDEGGYRLVTVVSGKEDTLVAEAGYELLPDGNGEFALTVAAGWRGWLGPYLLDALVATAAARGVPNLQADILVDNARMLALVADRGYVVLRHEVSEVRIAIDAAQPRPAARAGSSAVAGSQHYLASAAGR